MNYWFWRSWGKWRWPLKFSVTFEGVSYIQRTLGMSDGKKKKKTDKVNDEFWLYFYVNYRRPAIKDPWVYLSHKCLIKPNFTNGLPGFFTNGVTTKIDRITVVVIFLRTMTVSPRFRILGRRGLPWRSTSVDTGCVVIPTMTSKDPLIKVSISFCYTPFKLNITVDEIYIL